MHRVPCYVHSRCLKHWGSCTSLHPLLRMNEHSIKVCMNKAATAQRINISSISLTQNLIFIFLLTFILLCGKYEVLYHHVHCVYITGVLFACLCCLRTLGSTPTVWAHTQPALHNGFILLHLPFYTTAPCQSGKHRRIILPNFIQ